MSGTERSQPRGKPFEPGRSGNPRGPQRGSRSPALAALDAIGHAEAAELLRSVIAAAKAGDMRAADILLRRLWPERKGRPVAFDLPAMECAADLVAALSAVSAAVADGNLSPEEGQSVAAIIEIQRRAIETTELENRVVLLERAAKDGRGR